jgi:hypothetical protein
VQPVASNFERGGPNPTIDDAIEALLKDIKKQPPETQVKILNSAIAWEKVKHKIEGNEEDPFDPDA